ncbi:hypothetical protein BsWGS_01402 [Bradybaena similaris]
MDRELQRQWLQKAESQCENRIKQFQNFTTTNNSTKQCGMVWDGIMCWDASPPGKLQMQPCPDYLHGFDPQAFATKLCLPNGTWYEDQNTTKPWTNFSACHRPSNLQVFEEHGERLKLIQIIGYGVSLCSLVVAVLLMCCSSLKSKSNTLHLNLFLAFILRAFFTFLRQLLLVNGVGLEKDMERSPDGTVNFRHEGLHWECRFLHTTYIYTICASQMWIFAEGLYLHMLIYKTLTTERNGVKPYIILGWALPIAIITPWICVKALADNTLCWQVNSNSLYIWIIQGPMLTTVLLNFIFFLNIFRVLCSRVRSSQRHMGRSKYRRLAKFILVLIPLFGVFYIILAVAFPLAYTSRFSITHMYVEQTYNAFQGFLLALLFCFLNEEVHSEMKRIWWRRRTRSKDSVPTRSFAMSSYKRNSHNQRTSLNIIQPLRSAVKRSDSTDSKEGSWFSRLKIRVLRWLGTEHRSNTFLRRASTDGGDGRENSPAEKLDTDDAELSGNERDKCNNNEDEDDV